MPIRKEKIVREGYYWVKRWGHPNAMKSGYISEHRLVMSEYLGRPLAKKEVVHHRDGNGLNNDISNLQLFASAGEHTKIAHPEIGKKAALASIGRRPSNYNRIMKICPICKEEFETTAGKSGKTYCNFQCSSKRPRIVTERMLEGLKKGQGWNKGLPFTWAKKGKESPSYKHGRYSKHL